MNPIDPATTCAGYLVTPDHQWVPVANRGSVGVTGGAPLIADFVSATGRRTAYIRGTTPRTWQVQAEAPWEWAQRVSALATLTAQAPYSAGLYWHSMLGRHVNLLPSGEYRGNHTRVGIRAVAGEPVMAYTCTSGGYIATDRVPVQAGMEVVARAWQAGGHLQIEFQNPAGSRVGATRAVSATAVPGWVTVKSAVPSGAVTCSVVSASPTLFAAPSLRAGHDAEKFTPANTPQCGRVTLEDVTISHGSLAYPHSPISYSFTLREVH